MSTTLIKTLTTREIVPPNSKEACASCHNQVADLTCTCGKKYDFNCINEHILQITREIRECTEFISERMNTIRALLEKADNNVEAARESIQRWRDEQIRMVNEATERALNDLETQKTITRELVTIRDVYERTLMRAGEPSHSNLEELNQLRLSIERTMKEHQNSSHTTEDDNKLYASVVARLHSLRLEPTMPDASVIENEEPLCASTTIESDSISATLRAGFSSVTVESDLASAVVETELVPMKNETDLNLTNLQVDVGPVRSELVPGPLDPMVAHIEPSSPLKPLTTSEASIQDTSSIPETITEPSRVHEYDFGLAHRIERTNSKIIELSNDRNAGTICCHNNSILYNVFDVTTRRFNLIWLPEIENSETRIHIDWPIPELPCGNKDDECIQDIVYSDPMSRFLILNRARVRQFDEQSKSLTEFHTFPGRDMKRITCNRTYLYLIVAQNAANQYGDEVIVMTEGKEEKASKTFREIMPSHLNRGTGALRGEMSDIAVNANDHVAITYRFQRRSEVGVCIFKVTNEGRQWSIIKSLSLEDCWHGDLSYTPRIDWSEKLNAFILVEYISGHLVVFDQNGETVGENIFLDTKTQRESPLNISVSNNGLLCTRYASLITVDKING